MQNYELVEASAGSGKTRALVARYLSLLFLDQPSSQILALTFTNKAVSQMKERIINVISDLENHKDYAEEISQITSLSIDEIFQKRDKVLYQFTNNTSHIVTLDKFFNKILRLFCWYDNISIDFDTKENLQDVKFINYFLDNLKNQEIQYLITISKLLKININDIISLFFILLDKDSEVKSLINTNQIIDNEIENKIFKEIADLGNIVKANKLSSPSALKAVNKPLGIEDILHTTWIKKESLQEYSYFKKIYIPIMDDIFAKIKELLLQYCDQKQTIFLSKLLQSYQQFTKLKRKYQKFNNELCFSDIANSLYSILKNDINTDFLYFRLDSQISHILIDEFQDTSTLQYKILEPIINEILSGYSDKGFRTLFFVGDQKQSIYRFRGANIELMEKVSQNEQIHISSLKVNYRSSISVVKIVNKTFSTLYSNYKEQASYIKDIGYTQVSNHKQEDMKNYVIKYIDKILKKGYNPEDITILSFKNKDLLIVNDWIKEEFKDIKTITDVSSKLIQYPSVKCIIEIINFMYFGDNLYLHNFLHIANTKEDIKKFDIVKEEAKEIYLHHQNKNDNIFMLVLNITQKYNLYDENILLFLQQSTSYKDIIDFIYNISRNEAKIASSSQKGIRLSTIHNSKGLEFENVILLDQISGNPPNKDKLLLMDKDMQLSKIYLKIKNRDLVDKNYKNALNQEQKNTKIDLTNVLYVAMTRAKINLFIIKKDNKSKFDILNLQENITGELKNKTKQIKIDKKIDKDIADIHLVSYGAQKDFLHKNEDENEDEDIKIENIKNMEYGNAMHYMFESLYQLDISSIDTAFALTKNKYGFNINDKSLKHIKQTVISCINEPMFQELIKNKLIKKEMSFKYKQQIGTIDLFLEDENKVYIIDYKTSSTQSFDKYTKQISFYKQAMSFLYKKPAIGYLYFVNQKQLLKVNI